MKPSLAQGRVMAQFEALYYSEEGHTQETLKTDIGDVLREHPSLKASVSASAYHAWKRQESSPSIHDLEVLSRVASGCLTVSVNPDASTQPGVDDVWSDETLNEVVLLLSRLSERGRYVLLGEFKSKASEAVAKELSKNPHESDAAHGPSSVRRTR